MTFLVRVKMIDILEKPINAVSAIEARRIADEQCWIEDQGWERRPDFASAEIDSVELEVYNDKVRS